MARKRTLDTTPTQIFPGFVKSSDSQEYAFEIDKVEACRHWFRTSDYRYRFVQRELMIQFGSNSGFESEAKTFDRAVEIYIPSSSARTCFVESIWERNSALRDEPFVETLKRVLSEEERNDAEKYGCNKGLPSDRGNNFRSFDSNFARSVIFNTQCSTEFFLVPASFVTYQATGRVRPGDQVLSIITVTMTPSLMYSFTFNMKKEFENRPELSGENLL